jgi:hypothetical protein
MEEDGEAEKKYTTSISVNVFSENEKVESIMLKENLEN